MTSIFLCFVAVAVIAVVVVSAAHVDKTNEDLEKEKSAYATTQLVRTFTQTPLLIDGQEETVAHYLNEYFSLHSSFAKHDLQRRTQLRYELRNLAKQTIQPHLKFPDKGHSYLEATLYRFGREADKLVIITTKGVNKNNVLEDDTVYIGFFQQETTVQLPTYFPDSYVPAGEAYIILEVHETKP